MEIELRQLVENLLVTLVGEERDAGVLVAPDAIHHDESDEHPRGDHRIDLAEFAGVDAAANDSAEEILPASYNLVGVELGEVGELVQLSEYEAVDGAEDRRADERPVAAHEGEELGSGTALSNYLLGALDRGDGGLADHLTEEFFLVGEVEIDRAFGYACSFGDVLEAGVGEAAFTENLERGLDDLLRPVFGAPAPFWWG